MAKFKIGDKVEILDGSKIPNYTGGFSFQMYGYIGEIHTITGIKEFDNERYGYFLNHTAYVYDERGLKLVSDRNEKIVITTDGKTTTAKKYDGKTVVKTAVSKCSPDDKFDFDTGAKIAVDRLLNIIEEKPLFNTKICIVKGDDTFKTGHIYEIIDGKIKNRDTLCMSFPIIGRFHSVKDVKDYFSPKRLRKTGETWSGKTIEFVEVIE